MSPNTSDPVHSLLAQLHHQPLLVVLRAAEPIQHRERLQQLRERGIRHVELAWTGHPNWVPQVRELRSCFPELALGAASVCDAAGVQAALAAGLTYAVSPILHAPLLRLAAQQHLALVPGVMSPTEVHQASLLGCPLVKLFPASSLGKAYWNRLRSPLGKLPACIAAGGLTVADVEPWLEGGVDAVALGGSLESAESWDALSKLRLRLSCRRS